MIGKKLYIISYFIAIFYKKLFIHMQMQNFVSICILHISKKITNFAHAW